MKIAGLYNGNRWHYNGRRIQWVAPEHCLLLVGYDDYFYYFNDPRDRKARTYYRKETVDRAYKAQGNQAIVIQADARTAREWKVRHVLSAFEMVKDKLPLEVLNLIAMFLYYIRTYNLKSRKEKSFELENQLLYFKQKNNIPYAF